MGRHQIQKNQDWKAISTISFAIPFLVGVAEYLSNSQTGPENGLTLQLKIPFMLFVFAIALFSWLLIRRNHQVWRLQTKTITKIEKIFGFYEVLPELGEPVLDKYHRKYGHRKEFFGKGRSAYYVCVFSYVWFLTILGSMAIWLI